MKSIQLLKEESCNEKNLIEKRYVMGSDSYHHPFIDKVSVTDRDEDGKTRCVRATEMPLPKVTSLPNINPTGPK